VTEPSAVTRDGYLPEAPWRLGHVVAVLGAGFIGAFVGGVLVAAAGRHLDDPVSVFGVVFPAQVLGSMLSAQFLSRRVGTGDWGVDFGLRLRPRHLWGLLGGVGLQLAALIVTGLTIVLVGADEAPRQEVAEIAEGSTGASLLLAFAATVVLAPLVEELIYRGMLLARLRRSMGRHGAVLVGGAVFAAAHLVDPGTLLLQPGLFLIGVVLGYAALRSGDLSLALFMHGGVNLTGFVLQQYADDLQRWAERLEGLVGALVHLVA